RASALECQVIECSVRLDACDSELRRTEHEAREIETEIRNLTGKNEIAQSDIDERIAELDRLTKLSDDVRSIEEAAARGEEDLIRIAQQLNELENSISELLAEAAAPTEQQFLAHAEIFKQRQQLLNELEKIPLE